MKKKYIALTVPLVIIVVLPISYFVAYDDVSDAVYRLGFDSYSGTIQASDSDVFFTGEFVWANTAGFPFTIDHVYIAVFVNYNPSEFDGNLNFGGPPTSDAIYVGNVLGEDVVIPANGKGGLSRSFQVTSEDALNLIRTRNYNLGADYLELTVSGTYMFWHFSPPVYFM